MNESVLYIISTPIGNLGDITYRAVELLRTVDVIVCEDTREMRVLLQRYGISGKSLLSYHAQSSTQKEDDVLKLLANGQTVGLASDRGTPGISDPGSRLIHRAVLAGVHVVPVPGAAAFVTALQASGASTHAFWYRGFIPHKKGRQTFLQQTIAHPETVVFYESPHRILKCVQQLIDLGIGDRPMILARELTKLHEEFLRGSAQTILVQLEEQGAKGEFVVIIDAPPHSAPPQDA